MAAGEEQGDPHTFVRHLVAVGVGLSLDQTKKELTGRTDIEIEISNQCARLIANAIIFYNSAILSQLLTKYETSQDAKALALIKTISPAAWRHIHLNGRYTFRGDGQIIDLDALVAGLVLA